MNGHVVRAHSSSEKVGVSAFPNSSEATKSVKKSISLRVDLGEFFSHKCAKCPARFSSENELLEHGKEH